jgi:hypothetical protein
MHEIEEMILHVLRADNAEVVRVGVFRGASGWKCSVTRRGKHAARVGKANELLAQLLRRYEIVEQ